MPAFSPRARKLTLRVVSAVVILTVAGLFAAALISGWDRVQEYEVRFDWSWPVACVLFALAVVASGFLWGRVIRVVVPGVRTPSLEAIRSHLAGWTLRYIPGVGSLLYKLTWAANRGYSRKDAFVAFTYENIYLQVASIVGGSLTLLVVVGPDLAATNIAVVIGISAILFLMLVVLSRPVIRPVLSFLATRKLRETAEELPLISTGRSLVFVVEYLSPRIINGAGVALLAAALFSTGWELSLVTVAAAYTVAGAIGILAVFVPGGLGVREGTFVAILTATGFDLIDAIVLAIVARFVSTLADIIVAALYGALTQILKGKTEPAQ